MLALQDAASTNHAGLPVWEAVGWLANACFFSRFLLQWLISERSGRVRAPRVFWHLSLTGSVLLALYLLLQGERVLLAGIGINAFIYWRNLRLGEDPARPRPPRQAQLRIAAMVLPAAALLVYAGFSFPDEERTPTRFWLVWSVVAQGIWSSRFLLQWWLAESRGRSHLPPTFWWVSLVGNGMLLTYALQRLDAVLIAGLSVGPLVQVRNLILGARSRKEGEGEVDLSAAAASRPERAGSPAAPGSARSPRPRGPGGSHPRGQAP